MYGPIRLLLQSDSYRTQDSLRTIIV